MFFRTIAAVMVIASAAPATAQSGSPLGMAMELGQVVGSAEACGMAVSEDALVGYMREHGLLEIEFTVTFDNFRKMHLNGPTSSTACAAVRASIEANGLAAEQ